MRREGLERFSCPSYPLNQRGHRSRTIVPTLISSPAPTFYSRESDVRIFLHLPVLPVLFLRHLGRPRNLELC
jgi:hypothetical protein